MKQLKRQCLKWLARLLFKIIYRVEVRGLDNYPREEGNYVVIANHVSYLDGPLLMSFIPNMPVFAINKDVNEKWWAKIFTRHFEMYPLDSGKSMAVKGLIKMLRKGRRVVIFPEGRISNTGTIMKVYEGAGKIAQLGNADIIPVRIDGAQYSRFGRLQGKVKQRMFPKITLTICPPQALDVPAHLPVKKRKQQIRLRIYDLMIATFYATSNTDTTLTQALCESINNYGGEQKIIEDMQREAMSLQRLRIASLVLSDALAKKGICEGNIGVFLPNVMATVVTFYALQEMGLVAAMLNYTAGEDNIKSALDSADIKIILTSRKFIEMAGLQSVLTMLEQCSQIIYLEDVRQSVQFKDKLKALVKAKFGAGTAYSSSVTAQHPAVILFTSGSSGTPKAVVLSHKNLLTNSAQVKATIDFNSQDIFFNALPLFHTFGLGVGMVLPVISGIKTFLYPSPLHYKTIPEFVYDSRATVLFGTNTFLQGYARHAECDHFQYLRIVIAGAEKLTAKTRHQWLTKYAKKILEGYGVTETSPALSLNNYSYNKDDTVGRLLPGIEYQLKPVEGITAGGRLWVKGDNIMLGYVRAGDMHNLDRPEQGWYDTGDIVDVDEDGFITILGRAKRFAKVAGEMISLAKIELWLETLWPDNQHCVCAVSSERKGEKLVLLTDKLAADRHTLRQHILAAGGVEIMLPDEILYLQELPRLGNGKLDYTSLQKIATSHFAAAQGNTAANRGADLHVQ